MKVAYFSESSADESALRIITESIIGSTEPVVHHGLRQRGWPTVRSVLPAVLKELHYHTEAAGLVLIVDSNGSVPHDSGHHGDALGCRLCALKRICDETLNRTRPRSGQPSLKVAIGLATPTIEAWLLCGVDPHVTEAAWINGLKQRPGNMPYTKSELKRKLYGTSHPSLALETETMEAAATRLSADLSRLEDLFPHGFGALIGVLRTWQRSAEAPPQ